MTPQGLDCLSAGRAPQRGVDLVKDARPDEAVQEPAPHLPHRHQAAGARVQEVVGQMEGALIYRDKSCLCKCLSAVLLH